MKKYSILFLAALACTLISGCTSETLMEEPLPSPTISPTITAAHSGPIIDVPTGSAALIDGQIAPDEWEDAAAAEMSDGSLLYLKYAVDSLFLAIDAAVPGVVNVGILRDGELHILHSSAALGSAVFQPGESGWQMTKNFEWCCRVSAPDWQFAELMETERWLSHNQYWGDDTQTEYQILIAPEDIRIAVTYLYRDQSGNAFWPVDLAETDLLQFSTPPGIGDLAIFSDTDWAQLIISN